mmetsp:Transcript_22322/g.34286  ORF Transcript_22322/g.34286 Transcript_22322/m.34286 type:complete len:434 (+) Transcript_22322:69-1370(+)
MLLHHRLSSSALSALLLLAAASNQLATAFTTPTPSTKIHQSNRHINAPITSLSARKKNAENEEAESLYNTSSSTSNSGTNPAKKAALEGVLQRIERNYGRGSIVKLGDADRMIVDVISSGSLTLDAALGGGYPKGRVIEIYGPESSGKTTLALHALAESQQNGGIAAFVDAEHALDPKYAAALGVDVDSLLVSQPDSGEMALDIVDQLVRSSAVDVIVVDSVAALVPRAELEGEMSDMQVGLQARLMSKALRKITASLSLSQCTVIFLNQLRSKVGVIYGSPEITSGGNALKFYASVRLDTRRREILPDNLGIRAKVKVVKNKVAAPFKVIELDILFGEGIDKMGCLIDAALDLGVVQRKGSWYSYEGANFAQGRVNASLYLKDHREVAVGMERAVREALLDDGNGVVTSSEDDEAGDFEEVGTVTEESSVLE